MNIAYFAGTSIIAYLGLAAGMIVSGMAREELQPGKRYFVLAYNLILAFIVYFSLEFMGANPYILFFFPMLAVLALFYYPGAYTKSPIIYLLLGIALYISASTPAHMFIMASLIFVHGTLLSALHKTTVRNWQQLLVYNLLFFICIGLFALSPM